MSRGFEENVPKARPRVRLGRLMGEMGAPVEPPPTAPPSHDVSAEAAPPLPEAPVMRPMDDEFGANTNVIDSNTTDRAALLALAEDLPTPREVTALHAGPVPMTGSTAAAIREMAAELTAELANVASTNAQLRADLDRALAELARSTDESRRREAELAHLGGELASRTSLATRLASEVRQAEEERDNALAQFARGGAQARSLREKAVLAENAAREAQVAIEQARALALQHEQEARTRAAERDEARVSLQNAIEEKERLAAELSRALSENEAAASAQSALEHVHRALTDARARAQKLGGR